MIRRLPTLAALLALPAALSLSSPAALADSPYQSFRLDNGMTVVVVENHRAPVVTQMVWYKVGALDEPPGQSGIAHFLEHLMFKGTDKIPEGAFSKIIAAKGGQDNAFTSYDYTAYYQEIAVAQLPAVMAMEADRMRNLRLSDKVVATERDVILNERRQTVESDPGRLLTETMANALFPNHRYGGPVIGWQAEMAGLSRDNAIGFYKQWYTPNNAILVISGDVTAADVKRLAGKSFGDIPARPLPARATRIVPPLAGEQRVTYRDPRVDSPSLIMQWRAPSLNQGDKSLTHPLIVLATILGDGSTSLFYRKLAVEKHVAAGVYAGYSPLSRGPASFSIGGTPADGKTVEAMEAELKALLAEVVRTGVSPDDLAEAKTRLIAADVYRRDSLSGPAQLAGQVLSVGGSLLDISEWPARIEAVTAAQVNAAAASLLARPADVTGLLLPPLGQPQAQTSDAPETTAPEPAETVK